MDEGLDKEILVLYKSQGTKSRPKVPTGLELDSEGSEVPTILNKIAFFIWRLSFGQIVNTLIGLLNEMFLMNIKKEQKHSYS